ncbi:putative N-acetyltransferase p20 [Colletotrichum siamense]|uniref:N-acetyltransferase p20 n=1 Tax=Colletotrichum siamense TaxID=690259 RepID=A0A9P5F396_COLSI|nr:putative N-acetyltransferase p20 [Colletotrichum siamense]KAF4841104.1 putative N-acetyltransferase p20 [Colletotrichum siamense]KAF4865326.1 putative N-acetyltransferase p20 [Colletotrichum siamense]KAF5492129.1 putative N-acetyltransferase p20 [Colletotrichum siamense]
MDISPEPLDFKTVKTTLPTRPLPPHALRQPVVTERLILRPVSADDLQALHTLRTQPEVMRFSAVGRVDADLNETRARLAQNLPPHDADNYDVSICLRATGRWIGIGGCKKPSGGELGWPEIGYMLQKDYWGSGYATEFVQAFLGAWWSLPRSECEIAVERASVEGEKAVSGRAGEVEGGVEEILTAVTATDNPASQKILTKLGFEKFKVWKEVDEEKQTEVVLIGYGIRRPRQ